MSNKTRIIFRADGNSHIGLGHVVRSLALAEMLRSDFECLFAIQAPSHELQEQIKTTCEDVIVLPVCNHDEERFVHELEAYIAEDVLVVLDGYKFTTEYQQNIKSKGCPLLCIDDIYAFPFLADVVLNQAGGVNTTDYQIAPHTKLLLGPHYALLRSPFLQAAKKDHPFSSSTRCVFVNMGGADPQNHTLQIASELEQTKGIKRVEIVVGSAFQHLHELESWLKGKPKFSLHRNLDADAMCSLMQSCAVAVTSASGVAYEYASVGGLLFLMQTANNQANLYNFLLREGIALPYDLFAPSLSDNITTSYQEKIKSQRRLFDGRSDERLRKVFQCLRLMANITLREVTEDDRLLLFDWSNDSEVRKNSFNPNPILPVSHTRWLKAKLEDKQAKLYIAEVNNMPAAHIRFEIVNGKAIISYLIGSSFRGKGLGHVILQKGVKKLLKEIPRLQVVEALVQRENIASIRSLEKAGFSHGSPDPKHPNARCFVLEPRTDGQYNNM